MRAVYTDIIFTYHVVNIKPKVQSPLRAQSFKFTYHVVNIKLDNDKVMSEDEFNLHIT